MKGGGQAQLSCNTQAMVMISSDYQGSSISLYFSRFYYIEDNGTFEFGGGNGLWFGIIGACFRILCL